MESNSIPVNTNSDTKWTAFDLDLTAKQMLFDKQSSRKHQYWNLWFDMSENRTNKFLQQDNQSEYVQFDDTCFTYNSAEKQRHERLVIIKHVQKLP